MIGLDSNILLRHLAQDDPVQSQRATAVLERLSVTEPGYASHVVLVETAWVLERTYKVSGAAIAAAITGLLQATSLVVQDEDAVVLALRAASEGDATFADALIGILATRAGCARTLTFDERALRLPGFERA